MRPDLHINQKNTQTSVEDLLKKGFKPREDFRQRYFVTKKYLLIKEYFCLIHNKFSAGARLHIQSTKKWFGVWRLEVRPVVFDDREGDRWTP